jgi:pimeloyl-ACP methyl ester carboxylesterase
MTSTDVELPSELPFVFEEGKKNPTSPSKVWLHGGTESHHEYTMVLSHLPKDTYHHILLDLPGHGVQSFDHLSMEKAIDQVETAIRKYSHARKCNIVGLSLGGVTSLCFFTKLT